MNAIAKPWSKAAAARARDALAGFQAHTGHINARGDHVLGPVPAGLEAEAAARYLDFLAQRAEERAQTDSETAEHARTSGVWGDSSSMVVERFVKLEAEARREASRHRKLAARLRAEGMPPDTGGSTGDGRKS